MLPIFSSKCFFAPMAGVSDPAFRLLCKEEGAGLVVTELTSVHSIIAKEKELSEKKSDISEFIEFSKEERPVSVQLFGSDIDLVCRAARIVEPYFDMIDFNMGCPAPHITSQMAGAALLSHPEHMKKLFSRLCSSVNKPVSLKMRSGVGPSNCYLFKDISKIAMDCGIQMLTLHPRTVKQGYSGRSDWSLIRELKEMSSVPVVGNGDIRTPEDAKRMIDETGCDYVMIGRGAMGNPFIFRQANSYLNTGSYPSLGPAQRLKAMRKYLDYADRYKTIKFSKKRMQAMQFTKGMEGGSDARLRLGRAKDEDEILSILEDIS